MHSVGLVWAMTKALVGAWWRGFLAGFVFWVLGELLVNMQLVPSGALALGMVGWAVAANVFLAPRVREVFDRTRLIGLPRKEQRSALFVEFFASFAVALVMGLFFEAVVYGLMQYFGVVSPYYCILAFGISFVSFWLAYAATGGEPETQMRS